MSDPTILPPKIKPQMRRSDPLNDRDVKARVESGEELTKIEAFIRRAYAQKKPIGGLLIGLGTVLTTLASFYPAKPLLAAAALAGVGGGLLVGGGTAGLKSDAYEKQKNALLEDRGLM